MKEANNYTKLMNKALRGLFTDALKISLKSPRMAYFIFKTIRWQKEAFQLRSCWGNKGVHVPPYMIASITNRCNLKCKGCYAQSQQRATETEVTEERLREIIREAKELGISVILLAGGEPLVRKEILDITRDFPQIVFLLLTNGLLIDEEIIAKLKRQKNVVPVISLEGYEEDTDRRRGEGVYEYLKRTMAKIKDAGIFFGTSLTVMKSNFATLTDEKFIQDMIDTGCKLVFFVEYVPFKEGTENWVVSESQRTKLLVLTNELRTKFPGLFVAFPGDEERYGGCMSAGRGFVHVSPGGNLEPCPFAPYSDINLKNKPLTEALKSEFLSAIRQNHEQLKETSGGCALWEKREWVQSLLHAE